MTVRFTPSARAQFLTAGESNSDQPNIVVIFYKQFLLFSRNDDRRTKRVKCRRGEEGVSGVVKKEAGPRPLGLDPILNESHLWD